MFGRTGSESQTKSMIPKRADLWMGPTLITLDWTQKNFGSKEMEIDRNISNIILQTFHSISLFNINFLPIPFFAKLHDI